MTPQLTKIKSSPAQAILVVGMGQASDTPQGQASQEFVCIAGRAAEGIRMPSPALPVANQLADSDPQKKISIDHKAGFEAATRWTCPASAGVYAMTAADPMGLDVSAFRDLR